MSLTNNQLSNSKQSSGIKSFFPVSISLGVATKSLAPVVSLMKVFRLPPISRFLNNVHSSLLLRFSVSKLRFTCMYCTILNVSRLLSLALIVENVCNEWLTVTLISTQQCRITSPLKRTSFIVFPVLSPSLISPLARFIRFFKWTSISTTRCLPVASCPWDDRQCVP